MFVISKKKICMILTVLVIGIIAVEVNLLKKPEVKETVALPVNRKVIVLDAGHGRRRWRGNNRRSEYQRQALT